MLGADGRVPADAIYIAMTDETQDRQREVVA